MGQVNQIEEELVVGDENFHLMRALKVMRRRGVSFIGVERKGSRFNGRRVQLRRLPVVIAAKDKNSIGEVLEE